MLSWLNVPVRFFAFLPNHYVVGSYSVQLLPSFCCKTWSLAFVKINSLKPVTCESFILLKFSQNYIPIFCILSAHISREISLFVHWRYRWELNGAVATVTCSYQWVWSYQALLFEVLQGLQQDMNISCSSSWSCN